MAASSFQPNPAFSYIPLVGTDLSNGQRNVDIFKEALLNPGAVSKLSKDFEKAKTNQYSSIFSDTKAKEPTGGFPTGKSAPDAKESVENYLAFAKGILPYTVEQYRQMSGIATQEQMKQMAAYMPLSMIAQRASIAANLQASKDYQAFLQQSPLAQQQIAESKQTQGATAAAGEAGLLEAMAAAQNAAKGYSGYDTRRFAGQSSIG